MGIMFSPDMLELVLSGKKTQTRRRVDESDRADYTYAKPSDEFPTQVWAVGGKPKQASCVGIG